MYSKSKKIKSLRLKITYIIALTVFLFPLFATNVQAIKLDQIKWGYYESFKNSNIPCQNLTNPKSQIISGPCWAFADMATLEAYLSKMGILEESLSEKHLLNWANKGKSSTGWKIDITRGASNTISNGYLTSWTGPVFEKECYYDIINKSFSCQDESITSKYHVTGIKYINNPSEENIKKAISEYGAVSVGYYPEKYAHAVSIVGWDDKSSRWLVKDSARYPNCYSWLSFKTKLFDCQCITSAHKNNGDEKIYQHDEFGVTRMIKNDYQLIVANVFDFSGNEILDSIMINGYGANSNLEIFISDVDSNGHPISDKSSWQMLHKGTIPYDGYFTLSLDKKIKLLNKKYAIIIKISKGNNYDDGGIGCQALKNDPELNLGNNSNTNKSFILQDNTFYDIQYDKSFLSANLKNATLSIKAITKNVSM